ncbi:helix-turn-helix transcriptional regulator [Actinopolymorpha alba]|uniref:helix-turn-helix transcriptional regulator n=1 Tax=Actinopolymorpha alba TaxID=533267 RepID=UPI000365FDA7|nr:helix-turn-helix domain-containing protein [Actinopolymorpha alba]
MTRIHESTRDRVAKLILECGPQTAAALAERLDVTPAAIRRHLDAMVAEGVVEGREQRLRGPRGRGRPAKVFALTDAGRSAFYQAYDDLAVSALRYIRETGGEDAVGAFARRLVSRLEERYRAVAASFPAGAGTSALAEALTEDGYAASVEPSRLGEQLCQHHCPVAHVAEQFPQLCEAETEVFSRLLGRHVQRLATIAHGDGVCTTHVPGPEAAATRPDPSEASTVTTSTSTDTTTRADRTARTSS